MSHMRVPGMGTHSIILFRMGFDLVLDRSLGGGSVRGPIRNQFEAGAHSYHSGLSGRRPKRFTAQGDHMPCGLYTKANMYYGQGQVAATGNMHVARAVFCAMLSDFIGVMWAIAQPVGSSLFKLPEAHLTASCPRSIGLSLNQSFRFKSGIPGPSGGRPERCLIYVCDHMQAPATAAPRHSGHRGLRRGPRSEVCCDSVCV